MYDCIIGIFEGPTVLAVLVVLVGEVGGPRGRVELDLRAGRLKACWGRWQGEPPY